MAEDEYNMIIGKIKASYENQTIDCDLDSDCDELDSDQVSEDFVDCQSQQIEKDFDTFQSNMYGFSRPLDRPDIYKFSEITQRNQQTTIIVIQKIHKKRPARFVKYVQLSGVWCLYVMRIPGPAIQL